MTPINMRNKNYNSNNMNDPKVQHIIAKQTFSNGKAV